MGLSRTVSEMNSDFSWKSQTFPHRVFCVPADWVSLEFGIATRSLKTRMMWLSDGQKSFKIDLAI